MTTPKAQKTPTETTTINSEEEGNAATRDYSKLRRAAASQSLSKLKELIALGRWKAKEIDENDAYNQSKGKQKQRQHASKSALHMAAWKGCLDNVKYLVEDVGCDINAYSKQEFSYGKTAIFFALTQSRPDVTAYLLQKGAKVTIVNNKGQSVLSLAASRFQDSESEDILETIQTLEEEQGDWWNFRASHSDGFEYGDLDPRFFEDRPLKETDVVTPLAINPTTKKTRKGGFLRRNPEAIKWKNACRGQKSKKRTRKKDPVPSLSPEEEGELDQAWESLLALGVPISLSSEALVREPLLEILRLSDKQRSSWVPQATARLIERFETKNSIEIIEKIKSHPDSISKREGQLLTKILSRLNAGEEAQDNQQDNIGLQSKKSVCRGNEAFASAELWNIARGEVKDLHVSCLEEADSPILTLSTSPILVDTADILRRVLEKFTSSKVVGIDTEWYTSAQHGDIKRKSALSTLQLAFWDSQESCLSSFVVDLLKEENHAHSEFHVLAKTLVWNLLEACRDGASKELPLVMGFAISHDLPVLERFLNKSCDESTRSDSSPQSPPCYSRVLDIQSLMAAETKHAKRKTGPPGLKTCVADYSSVPLSKECQCSDWALRPLTKAQLEYAGLDAAVLLVLLAEQSRKEAC